MLYNVVLVSAVQQSESAICIQMNLFTKQKQTHRSWNQIYGYQRGNVGGSDKLGDWDWHRHTTIYKIDN